MKSFTAAMFFAAASGAIIYEDHQLRQTAEFDWTADDILVDLEVQIKDNKVFTGWDYYSISQIFLISDIASSLGKTAAQMEYNNDAGWVSMWVDGYMLFTSSEILTMQMCGTNTGSAGNDNCGWTMYNRSVTDKSYKIQLRRPLNWTSGSQNMDISIFDHYYYLTSMAIDDAIDTSSTSTFKSYNFLVGGATTMAACATAMAATLMF